MKIFISDLKVTDYEEDTFMKAQATKDVLSNSCRHELGILVWHGPLGSIVEQLEFKTEETCSEQSRWYSFFMAR
jgi:hypothetical protein